MKWVLVVITMSIWDGTYKSRAEVGVYEKREECLVELTRIAKQSNYTKFICSQKEVKPTTGERGE